MERVLKVSYGYLKFTFGAMIASAIIFSLAALAIKSPRVWFLLVVLGVAAFFLVRSELEIRRRHSSASKRKDNLQNSTEDTTQWVTFAQTALLISGVVAPRPACKTTVVVSEWRHKHDRNAVPPEENGSSEVGQDDAEISLARKAIEGHIADLNRAGFTPAFISKDRTGDYLAAHQKPFKLVHPFPNASYIPGDSNVVIGFMLRREFLLNPENEIAEILKDSFDLVKDHAPGPSELPAR